MIKKIPGGAADAAPPGIFRFQCRSGRMRRSQKLPASSTSGNRMAASRPACKTPPARSDTKPTRWGGRTSQIAPQCQQGKQRGAAGGHPARCNAEYPRPEDTHRQAAQPAPQQCQRGMRGKHGQQIGRDAEYTAAPHKAQQADPVAESRVQHTGQTHQHRKKAGARQVAQGLADAQALFGKGRSPLAHGKLRRAGTDHQQRQQPETAASQQFPHRHAAALRGQAVDRHPAEQHCIGGGHQRPQQRQHPPAIAAQQGQKRSGQRDHQHTAPAVKGMQQAHGGIFFLGGAGLTIGLISTSISPPPTAYRQTAASSPT